MAGHDVDQMNEAVAKAVAEATAPLHRRIAEMTATIVELSARQEFLEKRLGQEAARRRIEDSIIKGIRSTLLTLVEDPNGGPRPEELD